jgi:hypothetical protein
MPAGARCGGGFGRGRGEVAVRGSARRTHAQHLEGEEARDAGDGAVWPAMAEEGSGRRLRKELTGGSHRSAAVREGEGVGPRGRKTGRANQLGFREKKKVEGDEVGRRGLLGLKDCWAGGGLG